MTEHAISYFPGRHHERASRLLEADFRTIPVPIRLSYWRAEVRYSVLMPVYGRERAEFLRQSLDSLAAQTIQANQVVIVKDGPLGAELDSVIKSCSTALPITAVRLEKQVGLGPALSVGLAACRDEIVARMDSDDICVAQRFENQLTFIDENPQVAAVGSAIGEFVDDPGRIATIRRLPCDSAGIREFAKFRNPLNHMTVMFRKSAVLVAGGYRDFPGLEDYDLWVRMLAQGMELRNLSEILVLARCGNGIANRRGGLAYAKSELRLYRRLLRIGFISAPEFALSVLMRVPVRVMPAVLRPFVYRKFLRQEAKSL